jgi:hypothetical protein
MAMRPNHAAAVKSARRAGTAWFAASRTITVVTREMIWSIRGSPLRDAWVQYVNGQ